MTVKEAYDAFIKEMPGRKVISCFEYKTMFVFRTGDVSNEVRFDCLTSVNKQNGEVRDFKPFHIPLEEYSSGKEITNFK